jgi:hypothetical protein
VVVSPPQAISERSPTGFAAYGGPFGRHRTPSWVRGREATRECGERRVSVVPQEELHFLPTN